MFSSQKDVMHENVPHCAQKSLDTPLNLTKNHREDTRLASPVEAFLSVAGRPIPLTR